MKRKSQSKRISLSRSILTKVMSPLDANHYGYVHGGAIMRYIDEAAYVSATRHSGKNVVTAAIDHLSFANPVRIGHLLILKSSVNWVGTTSLEIGVRIESEDPITGKIKFVGRAYVTMVALDALGNPTAVPGLILEGKVDRERNKRAQQRRDFRLKLRNKK